MLCTTALALTPSCGDDGEPTAPPSGSDGGTEGVSSEDPRGSFDETKGSAEGTNGTTGDTTAGNDAGTSDGRSGPPLVVTVERPRTTNDGGLDTTADSGPIDVASSAPESSSEEASTAPTSSSEPPFESSELPDPSTSVSVGSTAPVGSSSELTSGDESSEPTDLRLGCAGSLTATETVSGNLTGDITWSGVVRVTANTVLQNGAQLTIEPGTRIVVDPDVYVDFGNVSSTPTLFINGTEQEPVVFCGAEATPGYWRGLRVGPAVTTNSEVHHLRVFDAGGTAPGVEVGARILVDHLDVYGSGNVGVRAAAFGPGSTALSVHDSVSAVTLTEPIAVTNFPVGGEFSGNAENLARLTFTRVQEPTTYHDLGIPYLQASNSEVMAEATVTFEAGVDYRFAADVVLSIGAFANVATWMVEGTEEEPVVFQGASPTPAYWDGVVVGVNVTSSSVVQHLEIRHAGSGDADALDIQAPITVNDLSVTDNAKGVRIGEAGLSEDSTNWTIFGNQAEPLTVDPNALTRIPAGSYMGNGSDQIVISAGTNVSEGTVRDHGLPYYVEAAWDTRAGSDLTFEANTEFVMGPDTRITFGAFANAAAVTFAGTEAAPIRFIGADADFAGYWAGLFIGTAVQTGSSMDWTELWGAGGPENNAAALRIEKASFPVTHCSFINFDSYGIYVNNNANTTDYEDSALANTFDGASGYVANVGR